MNYVNSEWLYSCPPSYKDIFSAMKYLASLEEGGNLGSFYLL
jgi:hypothetical protein